MEIKNSHIMITGANRGIGRAFAKSCAEDGAHLHLVVRSPEMALIKEMKEAGAASATLYTADFSSRSSIEKLIKDTSEIKLDILFNNAGILTGGQFEEQSIDEIYEVFQVNIAALVHLTRAFLPTMLQRKHGKIINNSSVSAIMHLPGASTYGASKAAVMAFTECLKNELSGTGVTTLLLITPGIKTRMFEDVLVKYGKNYGKDIPKDTIPPATYAKMIREAVLNDISILEPSGLTGLALRVAKYTPQVFDWGVRRRFKR